MRKYKHLLFQLYRRFKRKKTSLSDQAKKEISSCLKFFEQAILSSNRTDCERYATQAKELSSRYMHKGFIEQTVDFVVGLAFALVIAILVRQIWFEPYEIPTGSMRPTLKEQDRLSVSKTTFGINIPLRPEHAYFSNDLVKRNGIITFTSDKMDIADADTRYFYLFPGKKQFVKRMIGKPGDTLYFYGGQLHGTDISGNDLSIELNDPQLELIDHIPFLRFEGQLSFPVVSTGGVYPKTVVHQMGQPIAILEGDKGMLLPIASMHDQRFPTPTKYGDLWGIDNFAMARLLTKEEAIAEGASASQKATLYLELSHHPSLDRLELARDFQGRLRPGFRLETSLIPLDDSSIDTLFSNLYTARFRIKNGYLTRYTIEGNEPTPSQLVPRIDGVPDGMYEFYYGKAYKIGWQGVSHELPSNHPLYLKTPERLLLWFNLGLDFNNLYKPSYRLSLKPHRYAYFRSGDLFVMGQSLWKQGDPRLNAFVDRETSLAAKGSYIPFIDKGVPDRDAIAQFGLKIPEQTYLVLGDNHAMSGDSRVFGFVPEGNLRGAPNWIFWPYGSRWGAPNQPPYPWFTLPNLIIWSLFLIVLILWRRIHLRRTKLPLRD